jgi:hypothetical protein
MGGKTLTLQFLIMDSGLLVPPDFLECVPTTVMVDMPRNDPGNGLTHRFGRFPCTFLKIHTSRVDDLIPEVGSHLKVLLSQVHPLIELLVPSKDTETHQTYCRQPVDGCIFPPGTCETRIG